MPVTGQELVINNIIKFGGGFTAGVNKTMEQVKFTLEARVIKNISLRDGHGAKEFRDMDHPYATRHGDEIDTGGHDPYYQVHRQGGDLRKSERGGTTEAAISGGRLTATAFVGLDQNIAPHAAFVVFGTSKMIPRPVLEGSRNEVLSECQKLIKDDLQNLVTTFKGKT